MRTIKFRAKVDNKFLHDNGKWVYGYLSSEDTMVYDGILIDEDYTEYAENEVDIDPTTVGQFVTTIDGFEVYEGDIFVDYERDELYFVEYDEESVKFVLKGEDNTYDLGDIPKYIQQTISNIHDNKGLL